ncbi:MAG: hypothetical protein E6Q97_20270 [Desulfurellales bacterium]|nr:MAG: hypothetical protein E6Q97_20270 [Desulfurellales bacterium]
MTAKFDIYDLNTPFVSATAPTQMAPTATTTRAAPDRVLRGAAYLLTFAGVVLLLAALAAFTPLGRIDADVTVPFVAVTLGTLAAIVWSMMRP